MPRRVAVAVLAPPVWAPPGIDLAAWRLALAEDVLDVFAAMIEVDAAVAVHEADADLLRDIGWPGLRGYVLPALDVTAVFAAAAADGYDQAVLIAGDAPDLPGMLIAKLLRPLTTRPVAAAPAIGAAVTSTAGPGGSGGAVGGGLFGLSATLPAAGWLLSVGLDELYSAIAAPSGAHDHRCRARTGLAPAPFAG